MRGFWKRFLPVLLCLLVLVQAALAYSTLEKGDSGSDVRRMQQALSALGYTVSMDGVFGTETRNTVREFQRDHQLNVDGKAGNETLTLLYALEEQLSQAGGGAQTPEKPDDAAKPDAANTAVVYCSDGGKLNLRKSATSGAKIITRIPTGAVVTVHDHGSKWCYVSYSGETGYVMTSFLRFDGSAPTLAPTPGSGEGDLAIVTCADGGSLNLRRSASSGAKVLTRIPNGTVVRVGSVDGKWCAVSYNGESGYVMRSFLDFNVQPTTVPSVTPTPTQPPVVTPTAMPDGWLNAQVYTADGGSLNLRKSASSGAKVLTRIPYGTNLVVKRVNSTWCSLSYNGENGYVMSKFLRFGGDPGTLPTPTPTPPVQQGGTATVYCENGGKLNLRAGAGTGYKVLYQLPNGSVLNVIVRGSTWSQVQYMGYSGYVNNGYLRFGAAEVTPTPTPTPTPTHPIVIDPDANELPYGELRYATVKTTSGSLNVRVAPDEDAKKKGSLSDGTRVVVETIVGDWCGIYWGENKGYVMRAYLQIAEPTGGDDPAMDYDTSVLTRVLRDGYTGKDVDITQQRLVELKYLQSASGVYDSATVTAVKLFQKMHGLTEDGKAGSNTFDILFSLGAFPYTPSSAVYEKYVIDYRDASSEARTAAITRAQKALSALDYFAPVTGKFDENLHDAIVAFQLRNGLTASGVLDAATQTRLYSGTAHNIGWLPRYSLEAGAGQVSYTPSDVILKHWRDVSPMFSSTGKFTVYDPATGLSWDLSVLSRGRHMDVQPTMLRDTLIMRKSFGSTSWDIHIVYALLPDGTWCMCAMHNRPHHVNTIMNNGFGGQNCVHFLRDMSETQQNDPSYGVQNQEKLREAWKALTGETINQ